MTLLPATYRALMDGVTDQICILDRRSGRIIQANLAALQNLQYSPEELAGLYFFDAARELTAELLPHLLQQPNQPIRTAMVRKDGSSYPCELRFLAVTEDGAAQQVLMIGQDLTSRHEAAAALGLIESRFRAIVSNTPGLVYQFRLADDGSTAFPYLSEACHALLGVTADSLSNDPNLFLDLILEEDRDTYLASMAVSAAGSTVWNWEGRLWIEAWKDIKWINLRATPRTLSSGSVQWEGIMTNITQSKQEESDVKRSRAQLAELSAHIERVKEDERTRIAREIHDDLGGNLTAIKMALALLKRRLPDDETMIEKADYVDLLIDRTIEASHRISVDLRPSILDFGIVAAIDWQAREFEKQLGIPCHVVSNKKEIELPPEQASALFRIFQESLTNISKHAKASKVSVRLAHGAHGIRLEVRDNGRGIAAHDRLKPKSFGIRGMIERAKALGGSLTVSNANGGGTMVSIRISVPRAVQRPVS